MDSDEPLMLIPVDDAVFAQSRERQKVGCPPFTSIHGAEVLHMPFHICLDSPSYTTYLNGVRWFPYFSK